MLNHELESFSQEFFQDIASGSHAAGIFSREYFFEKICEVLIEAGEINEFVNVMYRGPSGSGIEVDGYGGNPIEDKSGTLNLIISDFFPSQEQKRLTKTEMDSYFRRLSKFFRKARDPIWRSSLEESSPVFELAELIAFIWDDLYKVRLFLISNRELSDRVDGRPSENIDGKIVTYSVWDIKRLFRFDTVGRGRDDIEIDLEKDYGGAIPVLLAQRSKSEHESYLTILPGTVLAKIYEQWGARLLEQNVRVFLQARGNVNKGIKRTLETEPSMFFAYNNGITATAEIVELENDNGGLKLRKLKNFQIVNGGQTTASIHLAYRSKTDLERTYIQMKLSVVEPGLTGEIVPKISEFANSQNRVSSSDFFSNHPFHIRIEEFSRRIYAPSPEGTFTQSKWFYERARGQYAEARSLLTQAARRKFDLENPRSQLFSKTDLAKFINVWREKPDLVSRGAQTNFTEFADYIGKAWEKNAVVFNENWYKETVAKAIIFRNVEKMVSSQTWYQGGYRANIVVYTISKLAILTRERKLCLDFQEIWQQQSLSKNLENFLATIAEAVYNVLVHPDAGFANVTQWAKKTLCWERVKAVKINWQPDVDDMFISIEEQHDQDRVARKDQKLLDGIKAQTIVFQAGGEFWKEVRNWGVANRMLSPTEASILKTATRVPTRIPSENQSVRLIEVYDKLKEQGFNKSIPIQ